MGIRLSFAFFSFIIYHIGTLTVRCNSCHFKFANTMNLPCHHMFAVHDKAGVLLFPDKWSMRYLNDVFEKKNTCEESLSDESYQVSVTSF